MITQKEVIQNILKELQNSFIDPEELFVFFNQMAIEYCATNDFCDSNSIEDKKEAIKVIGSILNQLKRLTREPIICQSKTN